jgi:L-asparaginase II
MVSASAVRSGNQLLFILLSVSASLSSFDLDDDELALARSSCSCEPEDCCFAINGGYSSQRPHTSLFCRKMSLCNAKNFKI